MKSVEARQSTPHRDMFDLVEAFSTTTCTITGNKSISLDDSALKLGIAVNKLVRLALNYRYPVNSNPISHPDQREIALSRISYRRHSVEPSR